MPLEILTGRAKSGKSDEITRLAAENDGLLIVPETHSLSAEKKLLSHCDVLGCGGAEVLSFARLAHRFSAKGPFGTRAIDPSGKITALFLICVKNTDRLKVFKKSALKPGFAEKLLSLLKELKRYGVSPDMLKSAAESIGGTLSDKLSDIGLLYEKYLEFIASGYTDSDDDLSRLYDYLSAFSPLCGRHIYIDRFSSFTLWELKIISALASQAASVTVSLCTDPNSSDFQFVTAEETAERLVSEAKKINVPVSFRHLEVKSTGELSHLEENLFSFSPKIYEGEASSISLFEADSVYSEVYRTARKILTLVKSGEADFGDISVVCRTPENYSATLKSIFSEAGIPVTDTEKLSAADHPLFIYITSAVEASLSPSSLSPVLRYLKSGFSDIPIEETDLLENYILESGMYPSQFFNEEKWSYRADIYRGSRNDSALSERLNRARDYALAPLIPLRAKLKGKITADAFCRAVYEFMTDSGLPERVVTLINTFRTDGETDRADMTQSVYNAVISALDSLREAAGEEVFSASVLLDAFSEGLSFVKGAIIPSGAASVNFSGASRFKCAKAPVLFILGLNAGVFPKIPENDGLLSDNDKKLLNSVKIPTAPDTEQLNYEEQALLYSVLNAAEEKLFLSYPKKSADGGSLSPSSVIGKLREIFPKLSASSDNDPISEDELLSAPSVALHVMLDKLNRRASGEETDEIYLKLYGWFLKSGRPLPKIPDAFSAMRYIAPLSEELTKKLFPNEFKTSISRLETYSSCRFKYFMSYVLNARPRKTAAFSGGDIGSILHLYAESVGAYMEKNALSFADVTEGDLRYVLSHTTDGIIADGSYYLKTSDRALFLLHRLEKLAFKMLLKIKEQFEYGGFVPLGSEIVFDDGHEYGAIKIPTPDGTVRLTGKVDRADVLKTSEGEFIRIVDYKSGNKSFSFSEIYSGLNLQLSVYMLALTGEKRKPGGMLYFKFDDPVISDKKDKKRKTREEIEKEREEAHKLKGLLLSSPDFLEKAEPQPKIKEGAVPRLSGKYYSASLATEENFAMLFARVKKVISQLTAEMRKGSFDISPVKGSFSPCEYCDFKSACFSQGGASEILNIEDNAWEHFKQASIDDDDKEGGDEL